MSSAHAAGDQSLNEWSGDIVLVKLPLESVRPECIETRFLSISTQGSRHHLAWDEPIMPDTDEPILTSDEASDIHEMDNTDTQSSLLAVETTATTPTEAADPDTSIQTALIEDVVHEAWHGRLCHHVYVEDCLSDEASNAESDEESDWASESPSSDDKGLSAWDWMGADFESRAMVIDEKLDEYDKSTLRAFALKVDSRMSTKTFAKLPYAFPHEHIDTLDSVKSRVAFLSGLKPTYYDCCINSCCCFVGPHANLNQCPYCKSDRWGPNGWSRKQYSCLPLIPRLQSYYTQHSMAAKMRYHAEEHVHDPNTMTDIFDSNIYRSKLGKHVVIHGKKLGHTFFGDPWDVALGLSTDGFAPFKCRKSTSWPIILYNYNLPPKIHFHKENIIPLREVPGLKKPIDFDSFLWPIVEELLHLKIGVRAWDAHIAAHFILHAFLIIVAGDIPAISMPILCTPDCQKHPDPGGPTLYDPANLPLRTHHEILMQAREVQVAPTGAEEGHLAKCYGVKGVAVLSCLSSLTFPTSFPYDFMHLIWENLLKNIIALWTGKFKGLDEGAEESHYNADSWSFWALYVSPVVLARWFTRPKYYEHFVALIKLLHICLLFDITREQIQEVRKGFIKWVKDYKIIESSGPVWASWAFPMERYCGSLQPAIKSRHFPYASIDHYILDAVRLQHIKLIYNMTEELALRPLHAPALSFFTHEYLTCTLLPPCLTQPTKQLEMLNKIVGTLATWFDVPGPMVHCCLPSEVTLWGKVRIFDDGDTVHALASTHARGDSRDATYVRYEVLVDKNARYPRRPVILQKHTMYGQLQYLYTLKFKPSQQLHLTEPTTVILAAIRTCPIEQSAPILDIHYYSKEGGTDIVDVTYIQCLVGWVYDQKEWAIIDRSGSLSCAIYVDE
ncbi:hypothetical protein A0H81_11890 [Grifola frondosa]|uniref:Transposase family Tnp2 protein n=1 Tax=Grifola frondosa TaxID=5627 RepID=A0A1C7LU60_GRIFR|nr:hypothetical protein A0H81_11890 [Grifola frondosa]